MTIVANDILQVVANFTMSDGEVAKNVYYCQITDTGAQTQSQIRTQVRNWIDNVLAGLAGYIADSLVEGLCDIYRRNTTTNQWDKEGQSTQQVGGTEVGAACSNQESGVVYAFTDNPRVTSRKSFPGMLQAQLTTNTWSTGAQNALTAAAQRWINPINDEDITLVSGCWSVKNNDFYAFTGSGETKALVGSMDTRKP